MITPEIEALARIWMLNDKHYRGDDPDEIIGQACSGSTSGPTTYYDTEMTGKPKWHNYIHQAESTLSFIKQIG